VKWKVFDLRTNVGRSLLIQSAFCLWRTGLQAQLRARLGMSLQSKFAVWKVCVLWDYNWRNLSFYEFAQHRCMLICFPHNDLNFRYNDNSFLESLFFANREKFIHNTWGEVDIPTHVVLPVRSPCDDTDISILSVNIIVVWASHGPKISEICYKKCSTK
jgi:hypothetical protein